jgi:hypothetical protein
MVLRQETIRERVFERGAPRPRADAARAARGRRESREYVTTRLHTASRSHTLLRATTREHAVRASVSLRHVSETRRRVFLVDPVSGMIPRPREIFARREETRPETALVLPARRPERPEAVHGRAPEPEVRPFERAAAMPAPQAPPPNVEWIASQVIQQIDRRLVAYRERMGKA